MTSIAEYLAENKGRISSAKILLTVSCFAAALYFLGPRLFYTYSEQAITNAPLTTLRPAIPGTVETIAPSLGQEVHEGDVIAIVTNPVWDPAPLLDVEQKLRAAQSRVEAASNEITGLKLIRDRLRRDYATWLQSITRTTDLRITAARQRLDAAKARFKAAETNLSRYGGLASLALVSAQRLTDIRRDYDVTGRDEAVAEAELLQIKQYRQTIDSGITLNENDRPPTLQRLDEIDIHLAQQSAALSAAEGDVRTLDAQREERLQQRDRETQAVLHSPVHGTVWQVFARPGESVREHADVIGVLDCDRLGVTAIFNQRYVENIVPNRHVVVRLVGVNRRLHGHIARINGYYKADDRVAEAIALKPVDEASVIVSVTLDEPMPNCLVGLKAVVQLD